MMPPVFLSASEPYQARAREYYESQNLANIRAAIRALCAHVLPHQPLVFGGHPAISPLVRGIAERIHHDRQRGDANAPPPRVVMFMCRRFLPPQADPGPGVVVTDTHDREGNVVDPGGWARNMSLLRMRYEMLGVPGVAVVAPALRPFSAEFGARRAAAGIPAGFAAAVFVGGMEGVEREFRIFRSFHPHTPAYAMASTGAAAARLLPELGEMPPGLHHLLATETAYATVFQQILPLPGRGVAALEWRPRPVEYDWRQHLDPDQLDNIGRD